MAAILCLTAAPLAAQTCPPVPDRTDDLARLFTQAWKAEDAATGRIISSRMWEIWTDAPDTKAQEMLDRGMERRAARDFDAAVTAFEELIDYCPDYAEGYNQRAFIAFMRQDYVASLADLNRALERSPTHVAALSGKALTLIALGREGEGQDVLRRALKLNPWLPERHLLVPEKNDTF